MKVVCIRKPNPKTAIGKLLTIGKTYEILSDSDDINPHFLRGQMVDIRSCQYFIADDGYTQLAFFDNDKDFITVEQHRENQLNKIGI